MITTNDDGAHATAVAKIERFHDELNVYRAQLHEFEELRDDLGIKRLRLLISSQHALIRRHCLLLGLERPTDVPERD